MHHISPKWRTALLILLNRDLVSAVTEYYTSHHYKISDDISELLLDLITKPIFSSDVNKEVRHSAKYIKELRNSLAHNKPVRINEAVQMMEWMIIILKAISHEEKGNYVAKYIDALKKET